jgi:hypothetical protein
MPELRKIQDIAIRERKGMNMDVNEDIELDPNDLQPVQGGNPNCIQRKRDVKKVIVKATNFVLPKYCGEMY